MSAAELLDLASKPIREGAPAGEPVRDAPEFESLQQEMRKLELPTLPEVAWGDVVRGAGAILDTRSKDLLVASWLSVALYERDGFAGLASGLTVMRDLLTNFWETLYPEMKRMRGRAAAISWLGERGAQRLSLTGAKRGSPEDLKLCQDRVREIGEFLAGRIEDGGTLLSELRRALDETASRQATPPAQPAAGAAVGAGRSTMESVGSPEEAGKALTEIRRLALAACAVLRESEPTNPLAYRLLRQMLWARVYQAPPQSDGQTQIPAPGDLGAELQAALDRAEWKGVLVRSEDKLATSIFWLDLHRYTVAALDGMGETYAPAAEAICEELAVLLKRVPELPTLRFADGTGLADDATRKWIQTRVAAAFGGGQAAAPTTAAPVPIESKVDMEGFEEARAEARKLSGKKLLPQALRHLGNGAARAANLPARAQWKLEMARLCLERGQPGGAEAMLENLDRELSQATYEDWRPELAAEILKTLLVCRRKAGRAASPEEAEKNRALLTRLYRVDMTAAMEVDGRS